MASQNFICTLPPGEYKYFRDTVMSFEETPEHIEEYINALIAVGRLRCGNLVEIEHRVYKGNEIIWKIYSYFHIPDAEIHIGTVLTNPGVKKFLNNHGFSINDIIYIFK